MLLRGLAARGPCPNLISAVNTGLKDKRVGVSYSWDRHSQACPVFLDLGYSAGQWGKY